MKEKNIAKILAALAIAIVIYTGAYYGYIKEAYANKVCERVQGELDKEGVCIASITKRHMDATSNATSSMEEQVNNVFNNNEGKEAFVELSCDVNNVSTNPENLNKVEIEAECGAKRYMADLLLPDVDMVINATNVDTDENNIYSACMQRNGSKSVKRKSVDGTKSTLCQTPGEKYVVSKDTDIEKMVNDAVERVYGQIKKEPNCEPIYDSKKLQVSQDGTPIDCGPVRIIVKTITKEDAEKEAKLNKLEQKASLRRQLDELFRKCRENCKKEGKEPTHSRENITIDDKNCGGCSEPVSANDTFKKPSEKLARLVNGMLEYVRC